MTLAAQELAACRDLPAKWFHPDRGESTREAKAVCAACPVRADCLRWAITNNEHFGIWGGTSERERRRIKRRLARGEPVPELAPPDEPEEEEPVALTVATDGPVTTNGDRPVDPATGRPTDACVNCGRRYTPARRDQRFCRKECARAWYSSHPRSEGGGRQPRARKARAPRKHTTLAPVPTAASSPGPVDAQALLGQLLAGCDHWHVEADLGGIHITITRGRPAR